MKYLLSVMFSLVLAAPVLADVYPFEEEYSEKPVSNNYLADSSEKDSNEAISKTVQSKSVTQFEEEVATGKKRGRQLSPYNQITFKNFGTIMLNLTKGVGGLYKGLFTEAFPDYGSDLASIPAVTAELSGRMIEIERKVIFEADARQKEIDAYRESMQKPLTPEEQKLLQELQAKKD